MLLSLHLEEERRFDALPRLLERTGPQRVGTITAWLTASPFRSLPPDLGMMLMAIALCGAFVVAMSLSGFASALRAAAWSVDRLR